jgi:stress response protein SCP2
MFAKVALVALAAGAQVSLAAPVRSEERSLKAVGTAIAGGIAAGAAGAIAKDVLNNRSLSAIENFFKNLKRDEPSGLMVDTETGVIYMEVPDANEGRSLKAIGTAVAGGIASGAAGALVHDVLDNRSLSAIEGFLKNLKREEPEARSISAIENFFKNLKRDESSGLMVDTETGVLYMDVPDANEGRSLKAVGTAIAGGIASGAAGAIVHDVLDNRSLSAIENFFKNLKRDEPEARSISAIKNFIENLKRDEPSGLMVDTETGVIYMNVPDTNEGRSLKAIGTAVAGGIASGAAGAIVHDVLDNRSLSAIENFFKNLKREEPEARSISAIENFFKNLKREEPEARSISAIENFFKNLKRDELAETMSKRSIDDLE